jgi:hypothetical protein
MDDIPCKQNFCFKKRLSVRLLSFPAQRRFPTPLAIKHSSRLSDKIVTGSIRRLLTLLLCCTVFYMM